MKIISDKYTIYGRKKGRKKIHSVYKEFFVNCKINLETDIKINKKNIIDVGSGKGESTLFLAKKNPDALIIAIEIFLDGNIDLCKQLSKLKLHNVKIFSSNVLKLFDCLNKDDYFSEIWILFPDPWPKKKHYKRRLINDNFFTKVYPYLKKNGRIFIATDSSSYLKSIMNSIYKTKYLFNWLNNKPQNWIYEMLDLPCTKFFKKAQNSHRSSFFIELVKI
jgi:tRNA (guanine-N7-)-methyltransferase